jgi:hypothetical protein
MNEEDEAFEQLALKQGQWEHTSGNRKRQIMEREMNLPPKVPKAFPNAFWREDDGMDLRDYFAAKAMQGMLASGNLPKTLPDADLAEWVYDLADAMIAARDKS